MLILQKNSFKKNDLITNAGFLISLGILWLVFLFIPLFFLLLGIKDIGVITWVLLPPATTILLLCFSIYFVGKPGKLLRKLKLVRFRFSQITVSFGVMLLLLFILGTAMPIYLQLLKILNIETEKPIIDTLIKSSGPAALFWLCLGVIVLAPISEELIFRRFIFDFLAPRCGFIGSIMISSGLFALIHFSVYSFLSLFILGVGFQLIYLKFRSIYPAIFLHAFNNAFAVSALLLFPELPV
jgi:hypothetical protein